MSIWGWMAVVSILSGPAYADSLGEVAKHEQERREKKKQQQGTPAETRVIRDEDLAAAPAKDSKGTFNPGSGFASARATPPASPSSPPPSSGSITQVDVLRAGARQRLESTYASIRERAQSLAQAVQQYQNQNCKHMPTAECQVLLIVIGKLAMAVGAGMEDAEEAARQGWLNPGEVRAMRQRYGMDDAMWDKLVGLVQKYRAEAGAQFP